jgi:hypothetical protein
VAFFRGEDAEKMLLERECAGVVKHEHRVLRKRWWHGCVEEGIVKWLWGSFGVGEMVVVYLSASRLTVLTSCAFVLSLCFSSFQE